jgi:L-threonylcarbamoyladenylate synthase
MDDLERRIEMVLDGGATSVGVESTVLDVTREPPMILRPGGVSREALEAVIGVVEPKDALGEHEPLSALAKQAQAEGRSVGLLLADEDMKSFNSMSCISYPLGSFNNLEHIARNLYAGMRTLDDKNVNIILTRDFGEQGLGLAI